jgi:hypothetical protein
MADILSPMAHRYAPGRRKMDAEAFADEQIKKYGMPRSEQMLRALLEYTFTAGQMQGATRAGERITQAFREFDAKVPA